MSLRIRLLVLVLLSCTAISLCGNVTLGGSCSLANNRVDAASHVFETDCDTQTFCSSNITTSSAGICQAKKCRRDEWPFGYAPGAILPPLCEDGYYCPDEEDGCKGLIEIGGNCQLGRDGEILFISCFILFTNYRRRMCTSASAKPPQYIDHNWNVSMSPKYMFVCILP